MDEIIRFLKDRRNLGNLITLVILVVLLPIILGLIRQQQIISSRAGSAPIEFVGPEVTQKNGVNVVSKSTTGPTSVGLKLSSPLGLQGSPNNKKVGYVTPSLSGQALAGYIGNILAPPVYAAYQCGPVGTNHTGVVKGSCTLNGQTCTSFEHWLYNDGTNDYCDTNCAAPCSQPAGACNNPGGPVSTCVSQRCPNGDQCATGHTYCQYNPSGNTVSGCSTEVNNCATQCSSGGNVGQQPGSGTGGSATAPSCDSSQVNMSISPNPADYNGSITFNVGGGQGSTFTSDSWSGGVTCSGGFWGSKSCTANASGSFTWTHSWQNCAPNDCSIKSSTCTKSATFSVNQQAQQQCTSNPVCSGACNASANSCIGSQSCQYTQGSPNCIPASAPSQSCNVANGTSCGGNNYTCQNGVCTPPNISPSPSPSPSLSPSLSPSPSPSPTQPPIYTRGYKMAEDLFALQNAVETPYDQDPMLIHYQFANQNPGTKTIFVQFIGSDGNPIDLGGVNYASISVNLLAPDPVVAAVSCSVDISGSGVNFAITGSNFGDATNPGQVTSGNTSLTLNSWSDSSITATMPNVTSLDSAFPITITRKSDSQTVTTAPCKVNSSQITIQSIPACPSIESLARGGGLNNVQFIAIEDTPGGQTRSGTISIDGQGHINGLQTVFQTGKRYRIGIKVPNATRKFSDPFIANSGITLTNFTLPLGDIFPLGGGDGVINSFDYQELKREWGSTGTTSFQSRPGDLNNDGVVNSLDWACMKHFFGAVDDPIPLPGSPVGSGSGIPTGSSSAFQTQCSGSQVPVLSGNQPAVGGPSYTCVTPISANNGQCPANYIPYSANNLLCVPLVP